MSQPAKSVANDQKEPAICVNSTQEVQPGINLSDYTLEPFYEHNGLRGYLLKKKGGDTNGSV